MTPEQNRTPSNAFERPSARATVAPVQRGNYGIPPRQSAPNPSGPRSMDIMPPRPATPRPTPVQPVVQQPIAVAPTQSAVVAEQIAVPPASPQPLYTSTPRPINRPVQRGRMDRLLPKLRLALVIVASLLVLTGLARWATAGSISGDLIAAGAVSANDGNTMTIQFTADDGQLHKFTNKSNAALIPGTAVQVAYRSGAPDNSAKQVAPIKAAHSLGVSLFVTGVILGILAGLATLIMHRPRSSTAPLAKPAVL